MTSRPRRSAANKAKEVISVHARWADSPEVSEEAPTMSSRRSGRASGVSISREGPSSPGGDSHLSLTVKVPSNRLKQITARGDRGFEGGEILSGKRNRGTKRSYVVDSSPEEDEEEEAEIEVEEDDDDMDGDEDAEGEDDMDMDAEGDVEMDLAPPSITVSKPPRSKPAARVVLDDDDDNDDDDELSDPADSDAEGETLGFGDETMADGADEDAEGEEIEVAGLEGDGDEEEVDSEDDGSQEGSPDLTKMTKRQRARFEDEPQQYMKLSDGKKPASGGLEIGTITNKLAEVQAKRVFTAEELSMRRQEMARRRRNLSDKRNEEVKVCRCSYFFLPIYRLFTKKLD